MYISNIDNLKNYDKVEYSCDICEAKSIVLFITAKRNFKRNGKHICKQCGDKVGASKRPQCNSGYWTGERAAKLGNSIKNSEKYKAAILNRDQSGEKNVLCTCNRCIANIIKLC